MWLVLVLVNILRPVVRRWTWHEIIHRRRQFAKYRASRSTDSANKCLFFKEYFIRCTEFTHKTTLTRARSHSWAILQSRAAGRFPKRLIQTTWLEIPLGFRYAKANKTTTNNSVNQQKVTQPIGPTKYQHNFTQKNGTRNLCSFHII